jgi:hypothetical protein
MARYLGAALEVGHAGKQETGGWSRLEPASPLTSASGQSRHFDLAPVTSGLPRSTDIFRYRRHVSKVPTSDKQAQFQALLL